MPQTYTPIATYTVPSAQASYTFTSIPSTYTDLILIVDGSLSGASVVKVQLNGDTATNYSYTYVYGSGSATGSGRVSSEAFGTLGYSSTSAERFTDIAHFMNYSNTTTYKTIIDRGNTTSTQTVATVNLWRSTAAINSIKVFPNTTNLATGTTLTLYGIKAA